MYLPLNARHLKVAFWSVVNELVPAEDIPEDRMAAAFPDFASSAGAPQKEGDAIWSCLLGIAWDWPAWERFATKAGYETLRSVTESIAKMRPVDVLKTLLVAELKQLCKDRGVEPVPRGPKDDLVKAILKATPKDDVPALLNPYRQRMESSRSDKCRRRMAFFMAVRISSIAYNIGRYEQLTDPDLLELRPCWRFEWGGSIDRDAPKSCRQFHNKVLPVQEAKRVFPALPCDYLQCGCAIVADKCRR